MHDPNKLCIPTRAHTHTYLPTPGSAHEAELARQAAHVASLLERVSDESRVNKELAALLGERLDSGRRALESLLQLLVCLADAEASYSSAMGAAAKAAAAGPLAAPADSGGLAAAVEALVSLPAEAAAAHRTLHAELQVCTQCCADQCSVCSAP